MPKLRCACISYIIAIVCGVLLLILGLIFLFEVFPDILNKRIDESLEIRNGTDEFNRFVNLSTPIYTSFYFFNVTNKDEVNKLGNDSVLEQLGPYVFREEKIKEVSSLDEQSGTVTYKERRTYHFEPNMTKGSLNDSINHVNVVSIALADMFAKLNISFLIRFIRGQYIETHTVDQLIFSGFNTKEYFPSFISFLCKFANNCTFAFYYGKNGVTGQEFEVSSGVQGMKDFTEIKKYANSTSLHYWYGDTCNQLNGTDGQQFPPRVSKYHDLYIFSEDICRSANIKYEQPIVVEDIDALRFVVPATVFADPNKYRDNMCFCTKDPTGKCPSKAGVMLLAPCQGGHPILLSAPHFYQGESEYWERYKGLHPVKELHESFLDVEPLTGTVVAAAKRLQINLLVQPFKWLFWKHTFVKNVTYFPVFWVEEGGRIDPDDAAKFHSQVETPYKIGKWSLTAAIILGGVILLITLIVFLLKRYFQTQGDYRSFLLEDDADDKEDTNPAVEETGPTVVT